MIHFQHEDKTDYFKNKRDFSLYFYKLEQKVGEFLLEKVTPMIERVEIEVVRQTNKVAVLYVKGDKTGFCYEIVTITSSEKTLFTPYFECIFQLYYSGYRIKKEDIVRYSEVMRKKVDDYHEFSLLPNNHLVNLKKNLKHYPFEVTYERAGMKQTYLMCQNGNERTEVAKRLLNRVSTHHITIKVYQNPIMEMYKIAKENKRVIIRK
jgi:hypothetical protein